MIAWFARNGVAANLLMLAIAVAGIATIMAGRLPVEVFPEYETRTIIVSVPYRGATPEEVEESVVVRIEEAVAEVSGIEQISASAAEGNGSVSIQVADGYDRREVLDDIKSAVDSISTFPAEIERPRISLADSWRHVISVVVYGNLDERDMRNLGEQVRDDIASLPDVTEAELQGVRNYELSIEIDEATLQRYDLSFEDVSRAIRNSSVDVPAGTLKTLAGEVSLRSRGRAYNKEDFESIVIVSRQDGSRVLLEDIARVSDGFDENPLVVRFNGRRCVLISINREGNQNAIKIARQVREFMEQQQLAHKLPQGVSIGYWSDMSRIVKGRLDTLYDSALKSILLVFLMLTLFLRPSLAFWVVIGIPICFLGALSLMPLFDVTVNISSLFGFILVLGIVVDDAIVTGENIYTHQKRGDPMLDASINGAREVAMPVIFGVLTTMIAFTPQLFSAGFHRTSDKHIAIIVIAVLTFSLIETKLILPSHLTHSLRERLDSVFRFFTPAALRRGVSALYEASFGRVQRFFANGLETFVEKVYRPSLAVALHHRYLVLSIFVGGFLLLGGFYFSGKIPRIMFPRVASERATARLTMQEGTPYEVTEKHIMRIEGIVRELQEKYTENGVSIIEDIMTSIGGHGVSSSRRRGSSGQSNQGEVTFYVVEPENRSIAIDSRALASEWRKRIGPIVGAKELYFRAEIGRGGEPVDIQLLAQNIEQIRPVVAEIREHLGTYAELFDISDSLDDTREEIQLSIRPEAEQFEITMADLANQVRHAFYGEEVQRLQRGRDDLRVMLRYPEASRRSLESLEAMRIRTSNGDEVPFTSVAEATIGESFPRIQRIDRNRTINVRADADKTKADLPNVRARIGDYLDTLLLSYPGVRYSFEGEARDERENNRTKLIGGILLLFAIYTMLAIPFRSYVQPLIVMSAIPFGIVGAALGHIIEGWRRLGFAEWWAMGPKGWLELQGSIPISAMSMSGMIALAGVVVNDSLVLVDYVNRKRREGLDAMAAVRIAGPARFRAIVLTSFTTFAGLMPLLALKSTQAQFLIPMAISLGYGILFATFITLLLVPINYLILEDIRSLYVHDEDRESSRSSDDLPSDEALPSAG